MNIIDYCEWRGDIPFSFDPFNEVDNLCFAYMVYVKLDGIVPEKGHISMAEAAKEFFDRHTIEELLESNSATALSPMVLKAMGESRRFRNAKLHNYVSILHEDKMEQFSAVMADLDDGTTVVAFRGTDDTMIGWQEDLLLSIKTIEAQKDACEYVNRHCTSPFRKYRLLGHSKGGNLAVYAALHCDEKIRRKIISVISNDGPGLRPGTYSEEIFESIKGRYQKIMPEYDVFGNIFDDNDDKMIIRSSAARIMQHNGLSWQVAKNHFVMAERNTRDSLLIGNALNIFLEETTAEQRRIFIDGLGKALEEAHIDSMTDFADGGISAVLKALRQFASVDDTAKETAMKLVKSLAGVYGDELLEAFNTGKNYVIKIRNDINVRIENRVNEAGVLLGRIRPLRRRPSKEETNKRYYEAYENRYKTIHKMGYSWAGKESTPIVKKMIDKYGMKKTDNILEIGCGEGRDAKALLENGFGLKALDVSKEAIDYCRKLVPEHADSFFVHDILRDKLEERYDFIYAIAVVHMLVPDKDRDGFYSFIREHLEDDGLALICSMGDGEMEMKSDISNAFKLIEREHESGTVKVASTSCRMVNFKTFEEEIERNGLMIVEKGLTSCMPDFDKMMYALVRKGK